MKYILFLILCNWLLTARAQVRVLKISTDKTTSLIFPFPVKHVDRGSREILVQGVPEAEHILLIKAATADFGETNLSVVTGDGQLYTFRVCYESRPEAWVYEVSVPPNHSMATQAACILDNPSTVQGIRSRKWDIRARVRGLYSKQDVLYLQLEITNSGPIDYELDYLRFFLRDRRKVKRTAIQELEHPAQHIAGRTSRVRGRSTAVMVIALEKFTLPPAQYFMIDIGEKKGGRHLQLILDNHHLIRAIPL